MSRLDEALEASLQDATQLENYYRQTLDSDFYIPLQDDGSETPMNAREAVRPLILESDGKPYLLLFDSEERLNAWAKQSIHFAILAGHGAAALSPPGLHWAVNLGGQFSKEFVPEEIEHLKSLAATDESSA